jgi:hypothetical protein
MLAGGPEGIEAFVRGALDDALGVFRQKVAVALERSRLGFHAFGIVGVVAVALGQRGPRVLRGFTLRLGLGERDERAIEIAQFAGPAAEFAGGAANSCPMMEKRSYAERMIMRSAPLSDLRPALLSTA